MPQNLVHNESPEMEVAVLSETGRRKENQDWMSWSRVPWGECYIVADGMGGYKGGALAARMTVEGLERHLKEQPSERGFEQALQEAIRKTNTEVYRRAQSGNPDTDHMGSTVAVALISGSQLQVGHVGDSRIYFLHHGRLKLLTADHTSVQRMVDSGMITETQARNHPEAHVLSRAVGSKPEVEIEIGRPVPLEEGDGVLLCSDGLSGYIEDEQIEKILRGSSDVQRIPKRLVESALKSGSEDNITVQFIRYGKPDSKKRRQTARLGLFRQPDRPRGFWGIIKGLPRDPRAWLTALALACVLLGLPYAMTWIRTWRRLNSPVAADAGQHRARTGDPAQNPSEEARTQSKSPGVSAVASHVAAADAPRAVTTPVWILVRPGQEELANGIAVLIQQASRRLESLPKDIPLDKPQPLPGCFILYPDYPKSSLESQAELLAEKLEKGKYCDGVWHFGPYKARASLQEYVKTKAGERYLLISLPGKEGKP